MLSQDRLGANTRIIEEKKMFFVPGRGASMNRRTSEQYLEQLVAWGPAPSKPVQSAGRVSSMQCGCPAPTSSIMPGGNNSLFLLFCQRCIASILSLSWQMVCVWGGGHRQVESKGRLFAPETDAQVLCTSSNHRH
jgi:hypothetical protein